MDPGRIFRGTAVESTSAGHHFSAELDVEHDTLDIEVGAKILVCMGLGSIIDAWLAAGTAEGLEVWWYNILKL